VIPRILGILLIPLLVSPAAPAAGPGAAEKEKALRDLRGRIEALQKKLASAEESRGEAADALKESETAISEANRNLRRLSARTRQINRRIATLGGESKRREAEIEGQRARLARLLYWRYVGGRSEPLKLVLNREDPHSIARRLHYLGYVSRARARLIDETRSGLAELKALSTEAVEQAAALSTVTAESRSERRRLEREKRARAQVLARLSRDIHRQRREIGTLKRDEQRLTRLIQEISRLVSRARRAPGLRNERVPDSPSGDSPFPDLKGRLHLPVRGELANRFGSPRAEGGVIWKGLFIAARSGDTVRAIADGRVVFADWLRGFGNLLIIDHGDAYMSLYGNNESLLKQVGEAIRGGEAVGVVGASGGNADSGLYFELRHQGRPLDPLDWVDIR